MVDHGKLRPLVDPRRFTLAEAAAAHTALTDRSANGKIVVDVH
ncbi:zinc-binding dehydrogenase [Streptomyces sp. NPDC006617]